MKQERYGWSDLQRWALFAVTAVCVVIDILGYPGMQICLKVSGTLLFVVSQMYVRFCF